MLKSRWIVLPSLLLISLGAASAGDIANAGAKAEQLSASGKQADALQALDAARDAIWRQSPLVFRKTMFVASDPKGFGIYDVRDGNVFKRSEPLTIYTEPMGYGYGRDGQIYVMDMALDFEIVNGSGGKVARQENFASWTLRSHVANKEFMGKLTYDFSGLEPGDYKVTTTVRDKNSAKKAAFTLNFKMVP